MQDAADRRHPNMPTIGYRSRLRVQTKAQYNEGYTIYYLDSALGRSSASVVARSRTTALPEVPFAP